MGYYTSFRASLPSRGHGSVFAVGHRVYVESGRSRSAGVILTDDLGTDGKTLLADGTEVEILAWLPRASETRYRVRSTIGAEGWLPASKLRPGKSIGAAAVRRRKAAPGVPVVAMPLVRPRGNAVAARGGKTVGRPKTSGKRRVV